ncbi:MAG TPA: dihydrodipicolinate synthase family protein, partial [Deferrisomatales bacterium]|nr:dihydrodipicolinate synthase family protein [Deferrisomatales bacterium]
MLETLQGVIPPVVTPFAGEELDVEAFRANVARWDQTGLSGYLVLGSNGENVFLEDGEKLDLVAACREVAAAGKIIMAGTGCESTRATVRLTARAAAAGADCALVITPGYYKGQMTGERLEAHYCAVADAAPIPILLYNVPKFTGLNLAPAVVTKLAAHPNIVGIKDSSGDIGQLIQIRRRTPKEFAVFVGAAGAFYAGLCVGASGAILAVANAVPELCVAVQERFRTGDREGALELQRALMDITPLVTSVHGIGGLKAAMAYRGYAAGEVRSPLAMPGPEARR